MCLITFSYKKHPKFNLVLVANRDEFFKRPTEQLHQWADHPTLFAGRDLLQGGTWLGLCNLGKFAAVTNYRNGVQAEKAKLSRGNLTLDFLTNRQTAANYMAALEKRRSDYGGFNLLTADASGMHYQSNSGGGRVVLSPGLYGLSNAHLHTPWPKVQAAREALAAQLLNDVLEPRKLSTILHDQTQAADEYLPDTGVSYDWEKTLSSSYIKTKDYGTRCTTVLLQSYEGDTHIFEKSFDPSGKVSETSFDMRIPVFGED